MYRLVQINITANWGSTGRIAENLGKTIMEHSWESYIAYGTNMLFCSSHLYHIGNRGGIYRHVLQTRLFDRHGLGSQKATKDLIKYIEALKPDIIHLHNIHGYYLNYPILFKYLSQGNVPVVWTLHDCWSFTGHCAYYDYAKCDRWMTGCHDCPQKRSYPASLFLDNSKKNYRTKKHWFNSVDNLTLVPVSEWLAGEVRKSFLGGKTVRVIHNGIDTEIFRPHAVDKKRFGLEEKFVVLAVASVWEPRKGLPDIIRLREILSEDYGIVVIGLNQHQMQDLPNGIRGVSRTDDVHELVEYYSVADAFVIPTWEDNFPTVNLEALACGTPVVTYRTGGSVETIDENTGFVVEKGDVQAMADAISAIKTKGKGSYSQACRERAVKLFNKKDRNADYISLYQELLDR